MPIGMEAAMVQLYSIPYATSGPMKTPDRRDDSSGPLGEMQLYHEFRDANTVPSLRPVSRRRESGRLTSFFAVPALVRSKSIPLGQLSTTPRTCIEISWCNSYITMKKRFLTARDPQFCRHSFACAAGADRSLPNLSHASCRPVRDRSSGQTHQWQG